MNNLLELKGKFAQKKRNGRPGPRKLPSRESVVKTIHLTNLLLQLKEIKGVWENSNILDTCLFSIYYKDIIAKSNRAQALFSKDIETNLSIRGAKYSKDENFKHIITHCVTHDNLQDSINKLSLIIKKVKEIFGDSINGLQIEQINNNEIHISNEIAKTTFVGIIVDCYYIEKFNIDTDFIDTSEEQIVSLYDTGTEVTELLHRIGIKDFLSVRKIDDTTILLYPTQLKVLKEKAPFLVSMSVTDLSQLSPENFNVNKSFHTYIPEPTNEPVIGVIDTPFDRNVYFSKWVKDDNQINVTRFDKIDYSHGTRVSSIIVDGPSMNNYLDDNCGRFRVKHFGVTPGGRFSSFRILQSIKEIVEKNKDIKVWNLSLGSILEVNENFISPEAAILDKIQYENDIIFIVAGTNKPEKALKNYRIGAPADSINSLVVNAVDEYKKPADYSREGIVLSFFNKPDIGYYGGTAKQPMMACDAKGSYYVYGTSYAAPWITRKMAYLIYKMGLSREVAKALLIDSAVSWKENEEPSKLIGFGVVPVKIDDIIKSNDDEIKFVMQGVSELYDTYTYRIPVPKYKEKQPFIAKATLCYFPKCNRNQGVDYTNTEMDLHFGRLKRDGKTIDTINDNKQNDDFDPAYLKEGKARKLFRKWDNVKHICEKFKERGVAKMIFGTGFWGLSVKTVERLNGKDGQNIRFGIVITLREIKGVNRIQEFKQQCAWNGWIVNDVSVEHRLELFNKAEEEIKFDN